MDRPATLVRFGGRSTRMIPQARIWRNSESLLAYVVDTLGEHPSRACVCWRLGHYLMLQGHPDQALTWFDATLALRPKHGRALTLKGLTLLQVGCCERAVEVLTRAFAVHPDAFTATLLGDFGAEVIG